MAYRKMSFILPTDGSANRGKKNIEEACHTLGFKVEDLRWMEYLSGTKVWVLNVTVNENSQILLTKEGV